MHISRFSTGALQRHGSTHGTQKQTTQNVANKKQESGWEPWAIAGGVALVGGVALYGAQREGIDFSGFIRKAETAAQNFNLARVLSPTSEELEKAQKVLSQAVNNLGIQNPSAPKRSTTPVLPSTKNENTKALTILQQSSEALSPESHAQIVKGFETVKNAVLSGDKGKALKGMRQATQGLEKSLTKEHRTFFEKMQLGYARLNSDPVLKKALSLKIWENALTGSLFEGYMPENILFDEGAALWQVLDYNTREKTRDPGGHMDVPNLERMTQRFEELSPVHIPHGLANTIDGRNGSDTRLITWLMNHPRESQNVDKGIELTLKLYNHRLTDTEKAQGITAENKLEQDGKKAFEYRREHRKWPEDINLGIIENIAVTTGPGYFYDPKIGKGADVLDVKHAIKMRGFAMINLENIHGLGTKTLLFGTGNPYRTHLAVHHPAGTTIPADDYARLKASLPDHDGYFAALEARNTAEGGVHMNRADVKELGLLAFDKELAVAREALEAGQAQMDEFSKQFDDYGNYTFHGLNPEDPNDVAKVVLIDHTYSSLKPFFTRNATVAEVHHRFPRIMHKSNWDTPRHNAGWLFNPRIPEYGNIGDSGSEGLTNWDQLRVEDILFHQSKDAMPANMKQVVKNPFHWKHHLGLMREQARYILREWEPGKPYLSPDFIARAESIPHIDPFNLYQKQVGHVNPLRGKEPPQQPRFTGT
jgi:hypothetical protein